MGTSGKGDCVAQRAQGLNLHPARTPFSYEPKGCRRTDRVYSATHIHHAPQWADRRFMQIVRTASCNLLRKALCNAALREYVREKASGHERNENIIQQNYTFEGQ